MESDVFVIYAFAITSFWIFRIKSKTNAKVSNRDVTDGDRFILVSGPSEMTTNYESVAVATLKSVDLHQKPSRTARIYSSVT